MDSLLSAYLLMKPVRLLSGVAFCLACRAFVSGQATTVVPISPPEAVAVNNAVVERVVSIKLGDPRPQAIVAMGPSILTPVTIEPGTRIRFTPNAPSNESYASVRWFRGSVVLATSGSVLEIPAATDADSGTYSCDYQLANGVRRSSGYVVLQVIRHDGQRLCNVSWLGYLNAAQPVVRSGLVIEPGQWTSWVLIRVVGPGLTKFGIADVIRTPQLKVFDSSGREIAPWPVNSSNPFYSYPTLADAERLVGAFPLAAGGGDVVMLYQLQAGAYSAAVSASSGSTGNVLVEIYQLPALGHPDT